MVLMRRFIFFILVFSLFLVFHKHTIYKISYRWLIQMPLVWSMNSVLKSIYPVQCKRQNIERVYMWSETSQLYLNKALDEGEHTFINIDRYSLNTHMATARIGSKIRWCVTVFLKKILHRRLFRKNNRYISSRYILEFSQS